MIIKSVLILLAIVLLASILSFAKEVHDAPFEPDVVEIVVDLTDEEGCEIAKRKMDWLLSHGYERTGSYAMDDGKSVRYTFTEIIN